MNRFWLASLFAIVVGLMLWLAGCQKQGSSNSSSKPSTPSTSSPTTQPGKELTLDLGNSVTMKLALIPAGKFTMGSPDSEEYCGIDEVPQRVVTISKPFYMGVYEVTQEQWTAAMGTTPWKGKEYAKDGATHAANYISWNDATDFCKKLSTKTGPSTGLRAGKTVSLPTEAQWEYACRAGSKTRFSYGDDDDYSKLGDYAWFDKNAWNIGEKYPHAVGQKKANAWGLYDMPGNVWEWCADWWGSYANAGKADPSGPASGSYRMLRGGSFLDYAGFCRSSDRTNTGPADGSYDHGFRVVVPPGL